MKTKIGIKEDLLSKVALELSRMLADEFLLATKTRDAHWNVEGGDFYIAHKLFEDQYELLDAVIDEIAERVRVLGHFPPASLVEFIKLTRLSEKSRHANDSAGFIKELLSDHEAIIIVCRQNIKAFADKYQDTGSSDFVTSLMEKHEKITWILRSHLK